MDEIDGLITENRIIGINSGLQVFSGYDEIHVSASAAPTEWTENAFVMPPAEKRAALADKMIALWTRYKEA